MTPQTQQIVKEQAPNAVFVVTWIAAMAEFLPPIAALLSAIWFALQITEKVTGKKIPVLIQCLWNKIFGRKDA
jgi:hypothetical protein